MPELTVDNANVEAAALLYDMAAAQSGERSRFGYKRAAKAILRLSKSVRELVATGRLADVPFVGPSSARIITEFVNEGRSATVEAATSRSGKSAQLDSQRLMRQGFLSQEAMELVLSHPMPASIVSKASFRGDLQMHTTWSDGSESIAAMAEACRALGHTRMGVTDHSYGLPVAQGMAMEDAAVQQREIDALNAGYGGRFRIFKGIEANILADGSLDLQPAERSAFEYVVAAPHSLLRRKEDQTARMLRAVQEPGVAILGHPRGRVFNTRGGIVADWPRIFDAAAERGVAVEIDGSWHRQDLDWELAGRALDAGCLFALDSDAHSIAELRYTDYAIAHARLAGIPKSRVINCWPTGKLAKWLRARGST